MSHDISGELSHKLWVRRIFIITFVDSFLQILFAPPLEFNSSLMLRSFLSNLSRKQLEETKSFYVKIKLCQYAQLHVDDLLFS